MTLFIAYLGKSEPVRFAAEELQSYLSRMDFGAEIALLKEEKYDASRRGTLWVGLDAAFDGRLPQVPDRKLDDAICLDVENCAGIVTGTNERSVLLAAYRLLRENGCDFVHPGKNGERVPQRPLEKIKAKITEKAASRHRGVCIEGAVGETHVLNMIRFLPKLGMNAYFIQFFTPRTFFDRYYANPGEGLTPRVITPDEAKGITRHLIDEIRRRGLLYHAVGHGWTCAPFGMNADSWEKTDEEIPDETREMLALVNGKRTLKNGIPLATSLCLGKKTVRDKVTDAAVEYLTEHTEVDYLHYWLSDGFNGDCECELCRNTLPSDFYVMMLNELDEKLTKRGIGTKIVFLLYQELLWAPVRERIRHPERFVLMFAPVSRSYSASFLAGLDEDHSLTPFVRNHNVLPSNLGGNLAQLDAWQKQFDGDGFDYDYHFMWDHHKELGGQNSARVILEDTKNIDKLGLNGLISCQNQRAFFPTALGLHAMAAGLWDRGASFDTLADGYFKAAYGENADEAREYAETVSELYDAPYIRGEKPKEDAKTAENYEKLARYAKEFEEKAPQRKPTGDDVSDGEWHMLTLHAGLIRRMAKVYAARAMGKTDEMKKMWNEAVAYTLKIERETDERLDMMFFRGTNAEALGLQ